MITLTSYADCREAMRRRELRQALYDEGEHLMDGVIVNLHGDAHVERRRLENRLFDHQTLAHYEEDRFGSILLLSLSELRRAGGGDFLPSLRLGLMWFSLELAGIDFADPDEPMPEVERLAVLMGTMARAATVVHATGDKEAIIANGDAALSEFAEEFYAPSLARRQRLVADFRAGRIDRGELPRDILTTLLVNEDRLDLPPETVLREVAYYPWVASHSTSNQVAHAFHHMLDRFDEHPADRCELIRDHPLRARYVHESMRLHPASPVARRIALADCVLRSGLTIAAGTEVSIDIESANRDAAIFGPDADRFNPFRLLLDGAAPWGLSFGHGSHACLGREMAGGVAWGEPNEHELLGTVSLSCSILLLAGARCDADDPPSSDPHTTRTMWGRYPLLFDPPMTWIDGRRVR